MVTKTKAAQKKGKVKVGRLEVNKETVKDLTNSEEKKVKGGIFPISISACWCTATLDGGVSCRNCI